MRAFCSLPGSLIVVKIIGTFSTIVITEVSPQALLVGRVSKIFGSVLFGSIISPPIICSISF